MSRSQRLLPPMYIALLQFEIEVPGAESLKDKRRVVKSIKDRFHREHLCSVAEVGSLDNPARALMALAIVGHDRPYLRSTLDAIEHKLRTLPDGRLGECSKSFISADEIQQSQPDAEPVFHQSDLDAINTEPQDTEA